LDRYSNVEDVFIVENSGKIKDKSIGLLDDVLTTGATLEACALALINAGAKEITILTLAAAE
jgi:predicted amidophosphoribosyltransferase